MSKTRTFCIIFYFTSTFNRFLYHIFRLKCFFLLQEHYRNNALEELTCKTIIYINLIFLILYSLHYLLFTPVSPYLSLSLVAKESVESAIRFIKLKKIHTFRKFLRFYYKLHSFFPTYQSSSKFCFL